MRTPTCTLLALAPALLACSGGGGGDGGGDAGFLCVVGDASYEVDCAYDPGFTETSPNLPNTLSVTFSGETLAISGLPYTPNLPGDPVFVDGWSVKFTEYLMVVDNVRLNGDPTASLIWAQMGPVVATRRGPFIVDAHRCHGILGKDGVEPASALFAWNHLDDGSAFDTGVRYAFSYDVVQASFPAISVNLLPEQLADYDLMVRNHWSKLVRGSAQHDAQGSYADPGNPQNAAAQASFGAMPVEINFAFGWDDHTQILNCINPDNGTGAEDNLANRGVQTNNNGTYVAQITLHADHVFWDTLLHEGEPLRLDPVVAWAPPATTAIDPFFVNDLTQQGLATVFQGDAGTTLPDRGPYMTGNGLQPFISNQPNPNQVIMNTSGINGFPRLYPDFMAFSAQSQMHLNAQGLCYTVGQHASDPYFVPNVQPVVR